MLTRHYKIKIGVLILTLINLSCANAQPSYQPSKKTLALASATNLPTTNVDNVVEERALKEKIVPPNFFSISFYKPNYLLPYYYTDSPYNSVYLNNTPQNEKLDRGEVKFQISFKVPLWKNILNYPSTLYLAYTQLSYWQAYNKDAFFRETDYEPELFLANEINFHPYQNFAINFFNVGVDHQSNGFGGTQERGWNRIYVEGVSSVGNWMISVRPWWVVHDELLHDHNSNITNYLGHGQVVIAYKYFKQVISLRTYHFIEQGGKRPSAELSWSFPLTPYLQGYVQAFSGYGQSLIEYNHRTNSVGLGIALTNWI